MFHIIGGQRLIEALGIDPYRWHRRVMYLNPVMENKILTKNVDSSKWSKLIITGEAHIDHSGHSLNKLKQASGNAGRKWETLIKTGTAHINYGWGD